MIHMNVMKDASELVEYNCSDLPVYVRHIDLSHFPYMRGTCHWHKDIEIIIVTEGEMNYHINKNTILIKEGDCVIINSQQLHYGSSKQHHACKFICIRFHPKVLNADPSLYQKYILSLIENNEIEYLNYQKDSPNYHALQTLAHHMLALKEENIEAYELQIVSTLYLLWNNLFHQCRPLIHNSTPTNSALILQKRMVSYLYEHYQEPITLDEISASAGISRSKCCSIFKQYLQQSPIDFLNKYRLEVSRRLLLDSQLSITQIALSCGFNHLSYYSKIFCREYGCTPTEYRKHNTKPHRVP